jgi:hypothetical protein
MTRFLCAIAMAACAAPSPVETSVDIQRHASATPHPPAVFEHPDLARYHMRRHFADLRMIERLLVAGQLDEGVTLAYLLVRAIDDPGVEPWRPEANRVTQSAAELARAESLDEAFPRVARVAAACADCHVRIGVHVTEPLPALPPTALTEPMAHHRWAADRLWDGLVMANDERWRQGLNVLAEAPSELLARAAPDDAARLQRQALDELAITSTEPARRATTYGKLLATCSHCHVTLAVKP